jgi:carbon monoxide dehydrogenase subunit G
MRSPVLLVLSLVTLLFTTLGCSGGVGASAGSADGSDRPLVVTPGTSSVPVRRTVSFSATRDGVPAAVSWSVQEPGGGQIDGAGTYTAPPTAGTFHVVATDSTGAGSIAMATVTVTASPVQVVVSPGTVTVVAGGTAQFSATVSGTAAGESTAVTWSVQESGGGTVDGSGAYRAPADTGTFHLVATSVADPFQQDVATVEITAAPDISVSVIPGTASTTPGGVLTFTAQVSGTGAGQSTAVTWSVQEGAAGGSIDGMGRYTAPSGTGTFHVVATSVADPTRKATATVQVSAAPVVTVSVSPDPATVRVGGTVSFTAMVTGLAPGQSSAVTWSVREGAAGGTVDASGRYTAPAAAGTAHVVATSVADPSRSDSATVTVIPQISVTVSPATATVRAGGSLQFTATVQGTTAGQSQSVRWTVREAGGGSVDASGRYSAPGTAGTFHVVATSAADPSRTAEATVTVTPPISVGVTPASASTQIRGTLSFAATVNGTSAGESTGVTWSVQEGAGGGSVDASGRYTAPGAAGTFHVVARSIADATRSGSATITVTAPAISVSVSPASTSVQAGGAISFTASVTGTVSGQSTAVTWSVQEGAAGGSIDSGGRYTAPSGTGTFHVVATTVADPSRSDSSTVSVQTSSILDPDRRTVWAPGVPGGVPARAQVCATVNASTYGNGSIDATSGIQAAINACAAGQVVQLSSGTFTINGGRYLQISKGITLRGAGPGATTLQKTDGAKPGQEQTGPNPSPLVIIGPARWDNNGGSSVNLSADAAKGSYSVTVGNAGAFSAGQIVLLDELSGAGWQPDPAGRGQIWASADFRVVWQRHNPPQGTDDPYPDALGWFSRDDRPTNEIKQIDRISGNTIYFNTPVHISYRTSHNAQLSSFGYPFTVGAGIEDLSVTGGDQGNIRFHWASSCWAKRIDSSVWHDEGFAVERSFRVEIRDSYVHDAAWAQPGGAGYAISLSDGSSEVLVENSIVLKANKVMVARSAGTASVFGYNYVDDGYINTNTRWIEVGLNASHMVGPHHVLFEGNQGFNWDSDKTHGNSIYHTVFRNHLVGTRRDFSDAAGGNGPRRCAGATYYSYWHSFVGNVMGVAGQMAGWVYESGDMDTPAIYMLGWDDWAPYPTDARVKATTLRHGNFDYVTSSVVWDPAIGDRNLPASLYLAQKPAFFNAGRGYSWPWVDPTGPTKLSTLPARARYEAGTPFVQP